MPTWIHLLQHAAAKVVHRSRLANAQQSVGRRSAPSRSRRPEAHDPSRVEPLEPRRYFSTATVDFESLSSGTLTSAGAYHVDASGYQFKDSGPIASGLFVETHSGDNYLRPKDWQRGVIVDLDGATFDLASFDYLRRFTTDATMSITGTLAAGGTESDTLTIDSSNVSGTKSLNWTGLTSVHIDFESPHNSYALFDDFVLSTGGGSANAAPTDVTLSSASFAEDAANGTTIGTLTATDPDAGDTHTFSLVGGDTSSFTIVGNELRTVGTFDFETQASYSVTVRATDAANATFDKTLALTVTDANDAPIDIALSNASFAEDASTDTVVGTLSATDADAGDTHTFTLVGGDTSSFTVVGNQLRTVGTFDYETQSSYSVTVRATDSASAVFDRVFALTVTDVAEGPATSTTVDFESLANGALTSGSGYHTDASGFRFKDAGPIASGLFVETHSGDNYLRPKDWQRGVIVDLDGATFDLASFDYLRRFTTDATMSITGTLAAGGTESDTLAIDASNVSGTKSLNWTGLTSVHIDFESPNNSYALFDDFVFSTGGGSSNAAPTDIALSSASFSEDAAAGTTVGVLTATDPDSGDTHTYSLTGGDTASFTIAGNELRTLGTFDYDVQDSYSVTVRATDSAANTFDEVFTISVTEVVAGNAVSWDGGGDGVSWNDADNWSADVLPGAADDVVIDVAGTPTIQIGSGVTAVNSLTTAEAIEVVGGTISSAGGVATTADFLIRSNGKFENVVLDSSGSGQFRIGSGGGTLDGVTLNGTMEVEAGPIITVQNGLTVNGAFSTTGASTTFLFSGSQTLSGTGTVTLNNTNTLLVSKTGSQPGDLTIGSGLTVAGKMKFAKFNSNPLGQVINYGTVRAVSPSSTSSGVDFAGGLVNHGVLEAESGTLKVTMTHQPWENHGTIRSTGGIVDLKGTFTHDGFFDDGTSLLDRIRITGTLDNGGGVLALDGGQSRVTLLGGTVRDSLIDVSNGGQLLLGSEAINLGVAGTLDGVTLNGDVDVAVGRLLFVKNGLEVNGVLTANASVSKQASIIFEGSQSLTGTGSVELEGQSSFYVNSASNAANLSDLIIETGVTVGGAGRFLSPFNNPNGRIINRGLIRSEGPTASTGLTIEQTLVNEGVIESVTGNLKLGHNAGQWDNQGTVRSLGGTLGLYGDGESTGTFEVGTAGAGEIILYGVLDNDTRDLNLGSLGDQFLVRGTIEGGVVRAASGDQLTYATLDSVDLRSASGQPLTGFDGFITLVASTLNADIDSTGGSLSIRNGLELNTQIRLRLGNLLLYGDQSVTGTGEVWLDHTTAAIKVGSHDPNAAGVATLEAGIRVFGRGEIVGLKPASRLINRGTIETDDYLRIRTPNLENRGVVRALPSGTVFFDENLQNYGSVEVIGDGEVRMRDRTYVWDAVAISGTEVRLDGFNYDPTSANIQIAPGFGPASTFRATEYSTFDNGLIVSGLEPNTNHDFAATFPDPVTGPPENGGGDVTFDPDPITTQDRPDETGWYRVAGYTVDGFDNIAIVTDEEDTDLSALWAHAGSPEAALSKLLAGATLNGLPIPSSAVPQPAAGTDDLFQLYYEWSSSYGSTVFYIGYEPLPYNPHKVVHDSATFTLLIEQAEGPGDAATSALGDNEDPNADGTDPTPEGLTDDPIRYFDGSVIYESTDLASSGIDTPFEQTRSWTNRNQFAAGMDLGNGNLSLSLPTLRETNGGQVVQFIGSGTDVRSYQQPASGSPASAPYVRQNVAVSEGSGVLTPDGSGGFIYADSGGNLYAFFGFGSAVLAEQRGQFKSVTDAAGSRNEAIAWDTAGRTTEIQRFAAGETAAYESWVYGYASASASGDQPVSDVTLRRRAGDGSWDTVRSVYYTYYAAGDTHGGRNDLKLVEIRNEADQLIDTKYYRYYVAGEANGYNHGLKYVVHAASFGRLQAATGDALNATDAELAPFANHYFEYDAQRRATRHDIQGFGGDDAGGVGTFLYAYTTSDNASGHNSWRHKTVETLPDGNETIVYANDRGQVMLKIRRNIADAVNPALVGLEWATFYRYDADGRMQWRAGTSAISGHDESFPDLLVEQNGNYLYLRDNAGLIAGQTYYDTTNATQTSAGGVGGYDHTQTLQRGELGTPVVLSEQDYFARSEGGAFINPVASFTSFAADDGTGAQTTEFDYVWPSGKVQPTSRATTLPVVTAAENGSGLADTVTEVLDQAGRVVWSRDADGYIHHAVYDDTTGVLIRQVTDVDTQQGGLTGLPAGWTTPAGGGLHLDVQRAVDTLGRVVATTDANGTTTYTRYLDAAHEVRVYGAWDTTTNRPTVPTQVVRQDRAGSYVETFAMSNAPALSGGLPTGTESVGSLESLQRTYTNDGGQIVETRSYFNLDGLTYSTAPDLGTEGVHYHATRYAYNEDGVQTRVQDAEGTITLTRYDGAGRPAEVFVGTDDTTTDGQLWTPATAAAASNLTHVASYTYDDGGSGDGNLTEATTHVNGNAADDRVTITFYDWRNRPVAVKNGVSGTEAASGQRPLTYAVYDNLGRAIATYGFDGDTISVVDADQDGVPDLPDAAQLRAHTSTEFDTRGRVFRDSVFPVDQTTGVIAAAALFTEHTYDARGQLVRTSAPGGLVSKQSYDGVGRLTASSVSDGGGDTAYADAFNVQGDWVLEESDFDYDDNGNLLAATARQRHHDATGLGALGAAGTAARSTTGAAWYDAANRVIAQADVGTNGGAAWARPAAVPARSDTTLVTTTDYDSAGRVLEVTDAAGQITRILYDDLGRAITQIEAYTDGVPSDTDDRTTRTTYDGLNRVVTLTADLPTGQVDQTTEYVYGVSPATGSAVTSNNVLSAVRHPDKTTGLPTDTRRETTTVNAAGQPLTRTDLNGSVHAYAYDTLGRVVADTVTTLGTGVDGGVRRIETAYDTAGRVFQLTSYDAAIGGSVVNQVQREYNGLGQLTTEYQQHGGAVNVATTPKVQYGYSELSGNANHSRPTSVTYPSGRTLTFIYETGIDDDISRVAYVRDTGPTNTGDTLLLEYDYLGAGTVVTRDHPEPGVALSYVKQPGEADGDAGDPYTGFDRFGRLTDQRWTDTTTGTDLARLGYGFDRAGNRTFRDDLAAPTGTADQDEVYSYDALHRLTGQARGELNATGQFIGGPASDRDWSLDALGNWESVVKDTDGDGTADVTDTRTHNAANEIVSGTDAGAVGYDAAGNQTLIARPGNAAASYTASYDAWNRLVELSDPATSDTLFTYAYDGFNRRTQQAAYTGGVVANTREFFSSTADQVLEERVTDGNSTDRLDRQYVWDPVGYVDALVLQDRDTTGNGTLDERRYALTDERGSVVALTDTAGTVTQRFRYDAYGKQTALNADFTADTDGVVDGALAYGFQGLHRDASGLTYNRARYWHEDLGRFISRDPAGYPDGLNGYAGYHVLGGGVDPSGLAMEPYPTTTQLLNLAGSVLNNDGLPEGLKGAVLQTLMTSGASGQQMIDSINQQMDVYVKHGLHNNTYQQAVIEREYWRGVGHILAREGAITLAGGIVLRGAAVGGRLLLSTSAGQAAVQTGRRAVVIGALEVGASNLGRVSTNAVAREVSQGVLSRLAANSTARLSAFGTSVDDLSRAGAVPGRGGQLTRAGHALTKHGQGARSGNVLFPPATGSPARVNQLGQSQLDDILGNPRSTFTPLGRGGVKVAHPDGRAARFDADGRFSGFVE